MRNSPRLAYGTTSTYQMTPSSLSLPMNMTEPTTMQLQPQGFISSPQPQMWDMSMNQQQQTSSPSDTTQMGYVQMPLQPGDLELNPNRVDTFPTYGRTGETSYDFHHASAPANTPIADITSPPLYHNTHRLFLPHMGSGSPLSTTTSYSDLAPQTSLFDYGTSFGTQEGGSVFPRQNTWPTDADETRRRGHPLESRDGSTAKSPKKRALGSVTARFRIKWLSVRFNQMLSKAV
jgi:hypothetical protein